MDGSPSSAVTMTPLVATTSVLLALLLPLMCLSHSLGAASGLTKRGGGGTTAAIETLLTSNWTLFSSADPSMRFSPISVPNTVVGALVELNAARIASGQDSPIFHFPNGSSDPFFGKNLNDIPTSNFTVPWTFTTNFSVSLDPTTLPVLLLNGVNYAANVSLNGAILGNSTDVIGGIRRFAFPVAGIIVPNATGANELTISVAPPLHSWTTDLSFSFLDWAPFPQDNSMGLWRDVALLNLPRFQTTTHPPQDVAFFADGLVVDTFLPPSGLGQAPVAYVTVSVVIRCFPAAACANVSVLEVATLLVLRTTLPGLGSLPFPTSNDTEFTSRDGGEDAEARFTWSWQQQPSLVIDNPPLWWPWQMGSQPLYAAWIQLDDFNISDTKIKFGLRQMTQAETSNGACQLFINNVPLLIRGGGWAPQLFYQISEQVSGKPESRIRHQLELVKHMNLNTIRLEGKFEYQEFFDIASELGLLVIPGMECCTSWQQWPTWTASIRTIAKRSVRDQIRRLGHFACNVAFLASSDELPPPDVEQMYRTVIQDEERWPNPIIAAASEQESTISGSTGVKMTGPYSWVPPSYWLADVDGEALNFGGAWGFLTEGGPGESPMTFLSWQRTVPPQHLWNATAGGSLSSWWDAHMGNPLGRFGSLRRFTPPQDARFGPSSSAEEFCYKAQLMTYEGIRAMYEGYGKMKHRNATGVINWMMNDAYPSHLWHLYDYYGVGGGGFYGARAAGEPLHLLVSYVDGTVTLLNNQFVDVVGPFSVQAHAFVVSPVATRIFSSPAVVIPLVPSDASLDLLQLDWSQLNALAVKASPQQNNSATAYLVQLVLLNATAAPQHAAPVASSWYFVSTKMDVINWTDSNGLWTNCSSWADFTSLAKSPVSSLAFSNVEFAKVPGLPERVGITVTLVNESPDAIAMFCHVVVVCVDTGFELAPAFWSDNFVTLLPLTNQTLSAEIVQGDCQEVEIRVQSLKDVVAAA